MDPHDDAGDLEKAQHLLGMYLDTIRREAVEADWNIRADQVSDLHSRLAGAMESWMRENDRWGN